MNKLVDVLHEIRTRHWLAGHQKLLLVVDQFEQHLGTGRDFSDCGLVNGLRQCDGHHVQALLLVRGDFWDQLQVCLQALGVSINHNHNYRTTDTFSPAHARKVLLELGQAHGCLLPEAGTHDEFAEAVVSEMGNSCELIPVRLALFAHAFRHAVWSVARLNVEGGVRGVTSTFAERLVTDDHELSKHRMTTIRILQSLLPNTAVRNTSTAKVMRTTTQISESTSAEPTICDELLQRLSKTPLVDVVSDGDGQPQYQLTHDHLIGVIRDWTNRSLGKTYRGRADRILRERTEAWAARKEVGFLPGVWNGLASCFSPPEKRSMNRVR